MIKKAVVTSDTPSFVSGRRGNNIVVNGEAIKPGERVPTQVLRPLEKQLTSKGDK